MRTLNGLYRAVCLGVEVETGTISCHVPQIFSDETVTCFDRAGVLPDEGATGWVAFEAGYPDHPVWMSGPSEAAASSDGGGGGDILLQRSYRWVNTTAATDPTHGRVKVNNVNPALATAVYLSFYDLNDQAFLTILSLTTGNLLAVYLDGNVNTRIEYTLTAPLINNGGQWGTIPVAVSANYGFTTGIPGNNAGVNVVVNTGGGGGGGGAAPAYTHNQSAVSANWVVTHNLGWYPNVTVIDSAGTTVEGDVAQVTVNQLTIHFSGAFSGVAYLS